MADNSNSNQNFKMNTVNGSLIVNGPVKDVQDGLETLKKALGPDATIVVREECETFVFFTLATVDEIDKPGIMAAVKEISRVGDDSHVVFADFRDVGQGTWMPNMPVVTIYDLSKPYCVVSSDCSTGVHLLSTDGKDADREEMLSSHEFRRHLYTVTI